MKYMAKKLYHVDKHPLTQTLQVLVSSCYKGEAQTTTLLHTHTHTHTHGPVDQQEDID